MNFMLDFPPVLNLVRGHNRDISIDNQMVYRLKELYIGLDRHSKEFFCEQTIILEPESKEIIDTLVLLPSDQHWRKSGW